MSLDKTDSLSILASLFAKLGLVNMPLIELLKGLYSLVLECIFGIVLALFDIATESSERAQHEYALCAYVAPLIEAP